MQAVARVDGVRSLGSGSASLRFANNSCARNSLWLVPPSQATKEQEASVRPRTRWFASRPALPLLPRSVHPNAGRGRRCSSPIWTLPARHLACANLRKDLMLFCSFQVFIHLDPEIHHAMTSV